MILMIDNYDSFVYNLVQYIGELGEEVLVKRNDEITIEEIKELDPEIIVLSPGPCSPKESGICIDVVNNFKGIKPILGICLGHQTIGHVFGGNVIKANQPVHGKVHSIKHTNKGVFKNLNNPLNVTRYHSLVVDPQRAFANQATDNQAVGNNQWMTTVSEFNKITQEMYDRGFVMVSIHDLINVVQDENGNTKYEPAEIMLPPDKKAFVLSLDDLSYYHAYDNYGYATKLLIDENGDVMNEYTDAQGNTTIGAYDVVPLMDQFVKEHPDASYRGAKGIIALTGYNGVLGYRTDITYDLSNPDCDIHQKKWIEAHPDFSLENERAEAKKVADAMKANGWEFASHTWGHLRVGDSSLARLQRDNEKWQSNVVPIVGKTDCIIFAHGQDLQGRGDYKESNEKYQYFRNEGFTIFCNVDSNKYTTWFGPDYLRQGRRNLDGYRIYKNTIGHQDNLSDLFDAATIIDPERPPVPEL